MRILFINSVSDRAGGASSAATLATALADAGQHVTLVCSTRGDLHARVAPREQLAVRLLRFGADLDPLTAAQLARVARDVRPDVVLADRRKDVKLLTLARAFGLRAPVVHRHGAPSVLRDGPLYRFAWRRLAAMIVNSEAMRAALLEATPWLDAIPIHVVHNGIDTDRFRPLPELRAEVRAELAIPADAFVVAFAGVLQPRKRVDLLARAAARLPHDVRPHILIIGDGPERHTLETLARDLGVPATFAGHHDDVPRILAAADCAAHLSAAEGFSNSVLEALACSLPVIATDEHSHPEQIDDGITGTLVRPDADAVAAALARLHTDAPERALLARAAREAAVSRFDAGAMVRGYIGILDAVVGRMTRR